MNDEQKAEIRKAYFKGEAKKYLNKLMEEAPITEERMKKIEAHLTELKAEDEITSARAEEAMGMGSKKRPPSVAELREGATDKEWREQADLATGYVQTKMDTLRKKIANPQQNGKIAKTEWLDTAVLFMSYLKLLDQDRVWKDQLYRARMTEIIDDSEVSRKEAEERAKLSEEYSAYKNAVLLRERIDEFINLAKKKDAENPYRT